MRRYLKYNDSVFVISESKDNKGHVYIKDYRAIFIGWIGYKGLTPGSGLMAGYGNEIIYKIIGIDNYTD